jgi:hypothetical protein
MAISRYDQRKIYEEDEANSIGTEYVRTDLLPAADAAKVRALLGIISISVFYSMKPLRRGSHRTPALPLRAEVTPMTARTPAKKSVKRWAVRGGSSTGIQSMPDSQPRRRSFTEGSDERDSCAAGLYGTSPRTPRGRARLA